MESSCDRDQQRHGCAAQRRQPSARDMNLPIAARLLPKLDPRPESQIDADLDDEFAFHIDQLQRELIEAGHEPGAARDMAQARFGNLQSIKHQCKRISLKERTMLQRVNFIMM